MARKAVFLDVDGTFLNERGEVPDSAREAVMRARDNGHLVFLCTGRVRNELWAEILDVGFDGVIAASGGHIEVDGEVMPPPYIAVEDVGRVVEYFEDRGVDFYLNAASGMYPSRDCWPRARAMLAGQETDPVKLAELDKALAKWDAVMVFTDDLVRDDVMKICFLDSGVPFEQIADQFGDRFDLAQAVVPRLGPNSGELTIPGVDKVSAIRTVLEQVGVPWEDTLAYGDAMNDLGMIQYVHTGVAMGNAHPRLKEVADQVTGSPDEHGIHTSFQAHGLI
jgi:Cof subfamily protein (haloacid dehalogenase superfamily)